MEGDASGSRKDRLGAIRRDALIAGDAVDAVGAQADAADVPVLGVDARRFLVGGFVDAVER